MNRSDHDRRRETIRALDLSAAALVGAGGYLHYCLWRNGYRTIPTIGTAFMLQVITSAAVVAALLLPIHLAARVRRHTFRAGTAIRLAGIGLSVGTLVAFLLSRLPGGIFHFEERGLQPAPQSLLTLIAEGGAILLLGTALVLEALGRRRVAHPVRVGNGPRSLV
jgi:hypothetical protein